MLGTAGEFVSDVLLLILAHVGRPAKIFVHQLSADTRCRLQDLPEMMDDRDGW